MWVVEKIKRTMAIFLGMTGFMVVLMGGPVVVPSGDGDWLNAMMNAVLVEQLNQVPFWGTYAPYVAQVEEVRDGPAFRVDPGKTMTLHFSTAPTKFGPAGSAESLRHALWCDIHPEVKGELYVIETRGEIGGG